MEKISASIVLYKTEKKHIYRIVSTLLKNNIKTWIIDNNNQKSDLIKFIKEENVIYIKNKKNIGYGRAHNIAINNTKSSYHLILNCDIDFEQNIIKRLISEMNKKKAVAITPKIINFKTKYIQTNDYLVPNIFKLFKNYFIKKNKTREVIIKKLSEIDGFIELPYLSGAFILSKTKILKKINGFSKEFFLYFEDVDISLKLASHGKIGMDTSSFIFHEHQKQSHKNIYLTLIHIYSFIIFSLKWFNQRKMIAIRNESYLKNIFLTKKK